MSPKGAERWEGYLAFWTLAGLTLISLGVAIGLAVHHGHRLGAFFVAIGACLLAIGAVLWQASKHQP